MKHLGTRLYVLWTINRILVKMWRAGYTVHVKIDGDPPAPTEVLS